MAVLVQGRSLARVLEAVRSVGGTVTHELGIISAVGARLTPSQIDQLLELDDTLRIRNDGQAKISGSGDLKSVAGVR